MRIAVLADLHLTACRTSVKLDVLEWLSNELRACHPDLVVAIGDLTALGTEDQSRRMCAFLNSTDLPWCSTPGNAEFRTSAELASPWYVAPPPGAPVLLVDSANYDPPAKDLQEMAALPDGAGVLLATHVPPSAWPEEARRALSAAQERQAIAAVIAGHQHDDGSDRLRGLDPDKSAGGPPMFEIWDNGTGSWHRTPVEMTSADIRTWPLEERQKLFAQFGVCTMWTTLENIAEATRLRIPHLELREPALQKLSEDTLLNALDAWRRECGRTLSLHLSNLTVGDDGGALRLSAERALRLGCTRVTLHVPAVTAADFPHCQTALLDNFLERMKPLLDSPVDIGIENLHTSPGRTADDQRNFGCTIGECRSWIETLRQATGNSRIGFHFDIGHARNNPPFNSTENLSDFYAEMGMLANGCHFHQVSPVRVEGDSGNHRPFTGLYEKMISLAGFFLAWRKGQFPLQPPIYLEIRGDGLGIQTYNTLRELIFSNH